MNKPLRLASSPFFAVAWKGRRRWAQVLAGPLLFLSLVATGASVQAASAPFECGSYLSSPPGLPLDQALILASTENWEAAGPAIPILNLDSRNLRRLNLSDEERGHNNSFIGTFDGPSGPGFVKVNWDGSSERAYRAAVMSTVLNHLGLGARFFGIVRVPGYGLGVALAFVEGRFWKASTSLDVRSFSLDQIEWIESQLRHAERVLSSRGIGAADAQFLVSREGRLTLIDPDLYWVSSPAAAGAANERIFRPLYRQLERAKARPSFAWPRLRRAIERRLFSRQGA